MRTLRLNFVERQGLVRVVGIVSLLAAILFCAFTAYRYTTLFAESEAWEANWRRVQKAVKKPTGQASIPKAEWERLQADLKAANRVIARIALPWDRLFREIEGAVDGQVTLLSVEPDVERSEVKITAEAKDFAAMLEYRRRLEAGSLFRDPHILSHQLQQQDPQKPVRFVMAAAWDAAPALAK